MSSDQIEFYTKHELSVMKADYLLGGFFFGVAVGGLLMYLIMSVT